jgi:hypothetical protein
LEVVAVTVTVPMPCAWDLAAALKPLVFAV